MPIQWIEIAADYRCNNRCVGCVAVSDTGPSLTTEEVARLLHKGRLDGATKFWFGGGDPTLRPDLIKIVKAARKLGYEEVKLQTNGMLLASPANAEKLKKAGVTSVNLSIKGHTAALHDGLTQTPGSFVQLELAAQALLAAGIELEGDVLVYQDNVHVLPELCLHFYDLGIRHFNLWHLSLFGADETQKESLKTRVPMMRTVGGAVSKIRQKSPDDLKITALHLPPCVMEPSDYHTLFIARELGLLVADPGGHNFMLEQSPFEGGIYLERCAQCIWKDQCDGLRADYLEVHGDAEFQPVLS
jgi:MoaA/NifB/PqqE/SkfB family radical SAM enzyme